ncbi:MAG TPA: aspartate kinase [Candidatus Rifleibacterium sp.]|nr:aspartate kinase [Candidatus Rifleibacterium sp.]HPT47792.1 aspartate kinase [Candidatus Rifleibacterium sp.]
MIVMKFGGSSLADAGRIKHVTEIIRMFLPEKPLIVVSAMGKTTDNLLAAGELAVSGNVCVDAISRLHLTTAEELQINPEDLNTLLNELHRLLEGISLIREVSDRTRDYLVSFGERLSARILAAHLSQVGINAEFFDAWDLGILSNSRFTDAEVLEESYAAIAARLGHLKNDYAATPIVTGFIARDRQGNITTLGRGGSDLTASILGSALGVDEIQVWKDVDGILTTDPRIVPAARPVTSISFEEASELAYFGAKVLHPRSILPAMAKNIPVRVKNSYNPAHPGTLILNRFDDQEEMLRVLTVKRNVTLVDIVSTRMLGQYGFLARVFQIFAEQKVSVDMLATSEVSISLTLDSRNGAIGQLKNELEKVASVGIKTGKTIVTMVGNVQRSSLILEKTFSVLNRSGINVQMISQGASKVNISFIVDDQQAEACISELHRAFFEPVTK